MIANELIINQATTKKETQCYHCGGVLPKNRYEKDEHSFCCKGCVTVYTLIKDSGLENIYQNKSLGNFTKPEDVSEIQEFDFLDNPSVQEKIISFKEGNLCKVIVYAPEIHCASCIWLLEHLPELHKGIIQSQVNFHSKKISILFNNEQISLKELSILLTQIGYKPYYSFEKKETHPEEKKLLIRLGIAGFAFGNIMLLSFPDYLDTLSNLEIKYAQLFHYVSFILSLPVILFSAYPYLQSAFSGIKTKDLNMDIPIGIGILTLFFRSTYDVFFLNESGYFDSLSGFVFFLLIGRWYQHKTYRFLDFDKTFHSFFPMSVIKIDHLNEVNTEVQNIKENDIVKLRNGELIPFECVLMSKEARIDYSFVTGESDIFQKQKGDIIYAGGKLYGQKILVKVKKPFDQQYFMQLWNENSQRKNFAFKKISSFLGKIITILVLSVAVFSLWYWRNADVQTIFRIVTSVLIIGCSCAFALSAPFLFGNVSRLLSKISFFVKTSDSIATLAKVNHIVLDKTGTLTEKGFQAEWKGNKKLSEEEINLLYALFQNSFHPLSKKIADSLKENITHQYECSDYKEYPGKGMEAIINDHHIKAGNPEWIEMNEKLSIPHSVVCIKIDDEIKGYFEIKNEIRHGLKRLNSLAKEGYKLHILTGDTAEKTENITKLFSSKLTIQTRQKPEDKKTYIENLQKNNGVVLMIGDGLNDTPALKTADFGISITDDTSYFAPAGDAILKGESLQYLPEIIRFSKTAYKLLITSYVFSFVYNAIGLSLAFFGYLSPVVAAVFMPFSSISVVLFAVVSTNYVAKKYGIK